MKHSASRDDRYIYIAVPWAPMGGGMFKVTDYLIQWQGSDPRGQVAQLRPLDTRGGGHAAWSLWVVLTALVRIALGRLGGRLAGVHVNMAERLSVVRKGLVLMMCRLLGVPVIVHLHAAQFHQFYRALPSALQSATRWLFSLPACVVVLGACAKRFVTEELGVPEDRVSIVINGVPDPAQPRREPDPGGVRRILFLGNLSERKGVSDLLAALARPGLPTSRLEVILAGGGDLPAYKAKARALGIDGFVRFEGWCSQEKVASLLAASDILVLPSYDEGLPLVILEALAYGLGVVCTPVGEIDSLLTDGVDARFVAPGDVEGLARSLRELLVQPELLQTLGRNGRALYEQRFSMPQFFAGIARIHQRYFGVAGAARPRAEPGVLSRQ